MIPNIFISSTIDDLLHLRDNIRDTIKELSYNPVMSEYGDIGYLPESSVEQSCYRTIRDSQLAILIVGKRYGSLSHNGLSITKNEFRTMRQEKIPVITLVEQEVMSFMSVFSNNNKKQRPIRFPGMDQPEKTFGFIQEIKTYTVNNAILPFSKVSDARVQLKMQLAHLFSDLLKNRYEPLKSEIKDVLAEIKTLRNDLTKNSNTSVPFLRAVRFMLEDRNREFHDLIKKITGSIDLAIPLLIQSSTFDEFLNKAHATLKVVEPKNQYRGPLGMDQGGNRIELWEPAEGW